MSMIIDQFQAEEQAFPQSQVVPSLANSCSRKRSPEPIFADGDHEPLAKKWRGFDSLSPNYTFEFSPSHSPEFAVELSPPDTTLVSQQLDDLASFCPINVNLDTLQMQVQQTSDPASASASLASAWGSDGETRLIITEQPEGYYRARYECEGRRGPVKGAREMHPSVQLIGNRQYGGKVQVKLVDKEGVEHTSCSLEGELTKKIGPHNQMTAEFDNLRIRREKKKEGGRKEKMPTKTEGRSDKVAFLLFTATLNSGGPSPLTLSCISDPIHLTAPQEPAELEWLMPESTRYSAGDYIVIKGSKMTAPKVTFRILNQLPNSQPLDLPGLLEKDKSHQNVLMVKAPPLPQMLKHLNQEIRALVIVTTGKSELMSKPLNFTYLPDNVCPSCRQQVKPPVQLPYSTQCLSPPHRPLTPGIASPSRSPPPMQVPMAPTPKYIPPATPHLIPHSVPSSPPVAIPFQQQPLPPVNTLIPNTMMSPPTSTFSTMPVTSTTTSIRGGNAFDYHDSGDFTSILAQSTEDDSPFGAGPPVSKEEFSQYLPNLPETSMGSPVSSTCLPTSPVTQPNSPIPDVERALVKLAQENHIDQQQYQFLMDNAQDARVLQAVSASQNDAQLYYNVLALIQQPAVHSPPL